MLISEGRCFYRAAFPFSSLHPFLKLVLLHTLAKLLLQESQKLLLVTGSREMLFLLFHFLQLAVFLFPLDNEVARGNELGWLVDVLLVLEFAGLLLG